MNNVIGHYFIFQIKKNDEKAQECLFMNSAWHEKMGRPITVANYELMYGGALTKDMELDTIYHRFNVKRPAGFKGHTLSNSDVIVTVVGIEQKCFYVDDIGFKEVPSFLDAWYECDIELAFCVGNRYLCLQTSLEGGMDYDIGSTPTLIFDGGVYEDETVSALIIVNELVLEDLKKDLPKYGAPGFNPIASVIKGSVLAEDDLIPIEYPEFTDRVYDMNLLHHSKDVYRNMVLEQFRNKNKACYEKWDNGYIPEALEAEARSYVEECFRDTGLTVKEVVFVGSRARYLNRSDSDYDFLVEYEGDMKEDGVFNILNQEGREYAGAPMDFNPIREEESGSLVYHLLKADEYLEQKANTYFRVYWYTNEKPDMPHIAFCRAYDEADALKVAERNLDLQRVVITGITPAKKHQITRQSFVFNCYDVIRELEQTATF